MATKTSILVFYLKVSENTRKVFRYASVTTLVVVNIAGLVLTGLSIFRCTPFSTIFVYPLPQTAKCSNILRLSFASAPVNIITDLAVLFLPIPTLTGLRLRRKQKVGVVILFGILYISSIVVHSNMGYRTWWVCHCNWRLENSISSTGITRRAPLE